MKRRLIQLSPTTLAITLPKKWTEKNSLKKGVDLEVSEKGKGLLLEPKGPVSKEKATIDLQRLGTFDKNFISTLYQAGYDEIDVIYDDPEIITTIQKHIDTYCIGFDIVEQTNSVLKIRSIASEIQIEFEQMYKKNIQIMAQMIKEIDEAVQKGDFSEIHLTRNLEERENKIQNLCLRYISKKGFPMNRKADRSAYALTRQVEDIVDCMKRICDSLDTGLSKPSKAYFKEVDAFVSNFYDMYYIGKKEHLHIFFDKGKHIQEKGLKLIQKTQGKETVVIHHLIDIVDRIYALHHTWFEIIN